MKKTVPIIIGGLIIAALAYVSFRSARTVSQSVVQKQAENTAETTAPTSGAAGASSMSDTNVLATGITLTVSSPANNSTVANPSVVVKGKTVAGAEVFVNDLETKADAAGYFSVTMTLDEGDNYILVVANDINGNYSEKDLTVTYSP